MNNFTFDKSLEELDPVKMLLFFLAFIAISFIVIFAFIVPNIKEYKKIKNTYNRHEMTTSRLQNILSTKEKELQKIARDNKKLLDALISDFHKENFIQYANKFFTNVELSKNQNEKLSKDFIVYELNVTSSIKSPQNFYNFLDGLAFYESVIKADFPIKMVSDGNLIKSSFNIKVYNLKDNK